jgi:hypothetical protein
MKRPAIDLHIDELILRNVPYAQRHLIAATVERELTRLLTEQGLPPSLAQGGNIPHLSVGNLHMAADAQADAIGLQIAQAVYSNLSNDEVQR